ncbi:hypothetical protein [Lacisediminimonas profundi]|uniref:hypothetical protein n=1 Tax=Lacisediminimonas profundi TaxID=2603856 RepID=UPI00124B6266|nr:hypothetical protein [Lacisediminimonas profundi]
MSKKSPPPASNVVALRKPQAPVAKRTAKAPLSPVPEAPKEVMAAAEAPAAAAKKAAVKKSVAARSLPPAATAAANDAASPAPAAKAAPKAAAKSAVKPAQKPAKPAAKPAVETVIAPAGKPAGKAIAKPAAKPAAKKSATGVTAGPGPVATAAAKPAAKAVAKPARKPASGKAASLPPATEIPPSATPPKAGSKLEKNLAARPANSLQSPIRIFQIYFEAWQKELLDPAFAALNNSGVKSEAMEFDVFERLARSEHVKGATLWGALSWRFSEKTGMSGADLIKAVQANPGMDVYYCNPYPHNEALYHNMWTQGETTHPRFLALSRALFQAVGLPEDELSSISTSNSCSAANYFIASPAFWSKYLTFVRKVLTLAERKLSPEARSLLHSTMADDRGLHRGATYLPFIVERLFPVFMKTEGKGLKGFKIALPEREREMNVHLKLLREMKDVAHRTKSPWLAACWVNYRNLYLSQMNGKAWCQKYLRAITPTDIKFG